MADKKEWTDDEVKAEIAAAVKIVAEDRERAHYKSLHEKYGGSGEPPKEGDKTPPKKETAEGEGGDKEPEKTRKIFWGNYQEGE